ncbi:hypothetical protein KFK09_023272 [Dendrobium nobile]|uniref:Uncharacterized protein n=1 Tax=Dendrobium nobile TaxID=94219 RepID=A0A8T3AK89_DENNO|nr:hypothetical protein KFK09_023272 [Dendrobium nobile]
MNDLIDKLLIILSDFLGLKFYVISQASAKCHWCCKLSKQQFDHSTDSIIIHCM